MADKFAGMNTDKTIGAGAGEEVLKKQQQSASRSGQQQTVTPTEKAEREASGHTQGRKGCKATRINMAFWSENHDFIKTMSRITGKTMTEYTNLVIANYRAEHPEIYDRAKALIADLETMPDNWANLKQAQDTQ